MPYVLCIDTQTINLDLIYMCLIFILFSCQSRFILNRRSRSRVAARNNNNNICRIKFKPAVATAAY